MIAPDYENDTILAQYLLFHYGTEEENCPWPGGPRDAVGFPRRIVDRMLAMVRPQPGGKALDIGCAVGRTTFALAARGWDAHGVDLSRTFIGAAEKMAVGATQTIKVVEEGAQVNRRTIRAPELGDGAGKITFAVGDALALPFASGSFAVVMQVNLIDRVPDPAAAVREAARVTARGGQLVIASPYTWTESYTPGDRWLNGEQGETRAELERILGTAFVRRQTEEIPFLIREHRRKFQWSVAQATRWERVG